MNISLQDAGGWGGRVGVGGEETHTQNTTFSVGLSSLKSRRVTSEVRPWPTSSVKGQTPWALVKPLSTGRKQYRQHIK